MGLQWIRLVKPTFHLARQSPRHVSTRHDTFDVSSPWNTLVSTRSTRRTCRVVSRRDEPIGIWALFCTLQVHSNDVHLICRTHPNYLLRCLFAVVPSIPADNKSGSGQFVADRRQRTLHKVLCIMLAHKDLGRLPQATCTGLLSVEWLRWNFDTLQRHLRSQAGSHDLH